MPGFAEIATALLGAAPELGLVSLVVFLLIVFIKAASSDRVDYRAALKEVNERNTTEIARLNADHNSELMELREDIKNLREEVDKLNTSIDVERRARREAEDVAAAAVRDAEAARQYLGPTSVDRLSGPRRRKGGESAS